MNEIIELQHWQLLILCAYEAIMFFAIGWALGNGKN